MTSIKPVTWLAKGIGWVSETKPIKALSKEFTKDEAKATALATVTSIVLKDGIGCAMYVTQSLNNKKIPDEKRKFVAALDLTNGVLMIAAQIAMFFAMRRYSGPLFDKLFHKSFNKINKSNIVSRVRMQAAKAGEEVAKKLKIEKEYEQIRKNASDIFKFVLDISAATIVGKRIIVPLIATPLAKKVQNRMDAGSENKDGQNSTTNDDSKTNNSSAQVQKPKLDVVSSFDGDKDTNLLNRYKKYYGLSYKFD